MLIEGGGVFRLFWSSEGARAMTYFVVVRTN